MQEAAGLKRVALAKLQRIWQAELENDDDKVWEAIEQWQPKLLGMINVEELNERTRLWEESRKLSPEGTATEIKEERKERALALCEWQGLVDREAVDMAVDLAQHTALHIAAVSGEVTAVELLLDAGCNPHRKNKSGQSALHLAVSEGHATVALALLKVTSVRENIDDKDNVRIRP